MVAVPPNRRDRPFPQELVVPGGELQTALRSGGNLPEAINVFCAVAFTQRELALAGASFLVATFVKDIKKLGDQVGCRHLANELFAGSSALCSLVAAYWDRKGQTDRLAELADEILARGQPATPHDAQAEEFMAALAAALAIPQPERAQALLCLIDGRQFSREQRHLLQEVHEWQMAGQLLSNSSDSERTFWQQELRRRRRNWFWDTEEGRDALRKLESQNPRLANGGSLIHRVVPQWAWDQAEETGTTGMHEVTEEAPPVPASPESAKTPASFVTPPRQTPISPRQSARPRPSMAVMIGAGAALLLALGFWFSDGEPQMMPAESKTDTAIVHASETNAPIGLIPQIQRSPSDISGAETPASRAGIADAPSPAAAGRLEPVSNETVVSTAQLVPVVMSDQKGWVKSPLGLEFQVTEANSASGRITDPTGKLWQLPDDPALVSEVTADRMVINPYSREKTSIADEQWTPGNSIAWGGTGWTFKLPDLLTISADASAAGAPATAEDSSPESPAYFGLVQKKTSNPVSQPKNMSKKSGGSSGTDDFSFSGAKLHPDYARAAKPKVKQSPARQPVTKLSSVKPPATQQTASRPPANNSFVTRANNIRMTYKQGYWESRPGAYLEGAGNGPANWARDMTLRERSSGTIPAGFVFEVADNGVVRVVPDPAQP